jgi:glycerol-3-phosphate dehydrogenase
MKREIGKLSETDFDLLIIGAGIHGVAAAWAAARRGLSVALVEKEDFGGATSANSLKVIHGGLRYLQHANLRRMRESISARSRFLRMAPDLVAPRPFIVPTSGGGSRGKAALRIALALNDAISCDRNTGLREDRQLPGGKIISRDELFQLLPALDRPEFTGGAIWHDGFAENTDRLNIAFVLTAANSGAVCANYVRAEKLIVESNNVRGADAADVLSGKQFTIRAKQIINAAGPWMDRFAEPHRQWVKAYNIIVRKKWFGEYGLALESAADFHDPDAVVKRGKRNLFFVPWRDGTMIGTHYTFFAGDPDARAVTTEEVEDFVRNVNLMYPALGLKNEDVTFVHVGIMPARPGATANAQPDKHSEIIDHESSGGPRGLISIKGVKYTTGLNVGEVASLLAMAKLGRPAAKLDDTLIGADRPVSTKTHVVAEEIIRAVRDEAALKLADVILRRTSLGSFEYPGDDVLRTCAEIMARELGWNDTKRDSEIGLTRRRYNGLAGGNA